MYSPISTACRLGIKIFWLIYLLVRLFIWPNSISTDYLYHKTNTQFCQKSTWAVYFRQSCVHCFRSQCFLFSFRVLKTIFVQAYDFVRNNLTISAALRDVMMYCGRGAGLVMSHTHVLLPAAIPSVTAAPSWTGWHHPSTDRARGRWNWFRVE